MSDPTPINGVAFYDLNAAALKMDVKPNTLKKWILADIASSELDPTRPLKYPAKKHLRKWYIKAGYADNFHILGPVEVFAAVQVGAQDFFENTKRAKQLVAILSDPDFWSETVPKHYAEQEKKKDLEMLEDLKVKHERPTETES